MSKEAIAKIREAEMRASEIRAEAEKEARRRVEQAEKDGAAEAARMADAASAEWKRSLEEVRRRSEALIAQSRAAANADIEGLEADARKKMHEATKLIVWETFDECQ